MSKLGSWIERGLITTLFAWQLPLAVAATTDCPAQDFDDFLHHFANDVAVQEAFVSVPLQSDYIDADSEPEPSRVSRQLSREQIEFPVMPDEALQRDQGLELSKQVIDPTQVIIKLTREDTDYQLSLYFRKEACWVLYRVQDDSL
jgi:hypothetical protein